MEFDNFKQLQLTTINGNISNNNTKSVNVRGCQIIIKNNISISSPPFIEKSLLLDNKKLNLTYALLNYYNKYEEFKDNINLVRLRTLTNS